MMKTKAKQHWVKSLVSKFHGRAVAALPATARAVDAGMAALVGLDFHYRYVSAQSCALFGTPAADLPGRSAFEFVHPDDRHYVDAFIVSDDLLLSGRAGVVYRALHPDTGRVIWIETLARALDEADPRYTGKHVLVHRDVTDRMHGARARQAGPVDMDPTSSFDALLDRDWARAVIDGSPMGVLLFDLDHFALLLAHDAPIHASATTPMPPADNRFIAFPKQFALLGKPVRLNRSAWMPLADGARPSLP